MSFSFNEDLAIDFNLNISVFLESIAFWIRTNAQKNRNVKDGCVWTYNSLRALSLQHKYFTVDQLRAIIKKCISEGLLVAGNFNKKKYDHTKWYSLTSKAYAYYPNVLKEVERCLSCAKSQKSEAGPHVGEIPNGFDENPKPIPVNLPTVVLKEKEDILSASPESFLASPVDKSGKASPDSDFIVDSQFTARGNAYFNASLIKANETKPVNPDKFNDLVKELFRVLRIGKADNFKHAVGMVTSPKSDFGNFAKHKPVKAVLSDEIIAARVRPSVPPFGATMNYVGDIVGEKLKHDACNHITALVEGGSMLTMREMVDDFISKIQSNGIE